MSKKIEDLVGKRFGRWTVISYDEKLSEEKKEKYWKCKCDCGREKSVKGGSLRQGKSKSCGCLHKEIVSETEDLTGKRFGRLVVIKREDNKNNRVMWLCKCDCGNEIVIRGEHLKSGGTQSCGCLQKEMAREIRESIIVTEETRQKLSELHKDKPLSEEHKQHLSEALYGKYRGKESPNYNPYLTDEDRQDRRLLEGYDEWSKEVKRQANFTCDCCGIKNKKVCSHHLNNYKDYPEERLNINNGVCLCEKCHREFHKWMGGTKIKCTKEDYINFKESRVKENE